MIEMLHTRPVVLDAAARQRVCLELDAGSRQATERAVYPPAPKPPRRRSGPSRAKQNARARQRAARQRQRLMRKLRVFAIEMFALVVGVIALMGFINSHAGR